MICKIFIALCLANSLFSDRVFLTKFAQILMLLQMIPLFMCFSDTDIFMTCHL